MMEFKGFRGFSEREDGSIFELAPIGMFEFDDEGYIFKDTLPYYIYISNKEDGKTANNFMNELCFDNIHRDKDPDEYSYFCNYDVHRPGIYQLEVGDLGRKDVDGIEFKKYYYKNVDDKIEELVQLLHYAVYAKSSINEFIKKKG